MTLLEINDLETVYNVDNGAVRAADGINLSLEPGETLGLVGESGSGKTTVGKSIMRLLPGNGEVQNGEINFKGTDITELSDRELRKQIRWTEIAMIPQNAMNAFDPVYTVGDQVVQAIRTHNDVSKGEAREQTRDLFERLGLEADRVDDYPHQFSGGMAQRAMVALAISCKPSLIIADEPTTALDVVIQDRLLETITELQAELGSAMILITHDMSVVAETCDSIAVMYGGRIVEESNAKDIISNPRHPYTMGLRNAFPDIEADAQDLVSIPGTPPELMDPDEGCRFAPRCPFAVDECRSTTPAPESYGANGTVECHRADEYETLRDESAKKDTWREIDE